MMADTVKKSRIVSENSSFETLTNTTITTTTTTTTTTHEDTSLQDIINEEFNQRLKTCMTHPNIDEPPDILQQQDNQENFQINDHNMQLNFNHDAEVQPDFTNYSLNLNGHCLESIVIQTQRFLQEEIQTDLQNIPNNDLNMIHFVDESNVAAEILVEHNVEEVMGEKEEEMGEKEEDEEVMGEKEEVMGEKGEVMGKTQKELVMLEDEDDFINKEIPSPENEDIDELTPPYENITVTDVDTEGLSAKERFLSTVTTTTDLDGDGDEGEDLINNGKTGTVKDRMFLSTDSACLLFTQTVVQSPMLTPQLTPTEENYDFLQALKRQEFELQQQQQQQQQQEDERVEKPDNCEHIPKGESIDLEEISEISAENEVCNQLESSTSDNEISINFTQVEEEIQGVETDKTEHVEIKPNKNNQISSATKVSEITKLFNNNNEEIVVQTTSSSKISPLALQEYPSDFETIKKTKEIFERNDSNNLFKKEDTNNIFECDSTTVTSESTFVETRTESNSSGDKLLKKKKSKKSKKDNEKENISVSDVVVTNSNNHEIEENLSHVSVKNLCRSFSDLTSISSKSKFENFRKQHTNERTKSMSDIRKDDANLENVFSHVSVKSLRECFDNVTNKTNNKLRLQKQFSEINVKPGFKTSDRIEKLKSSFSKFDALSKKTVLHVRSSDSGKAQEKFNGTAQIDASNCKSCQKQVFQMEQIKAEKAIWHKNCFRCAECSKQLNVDTYQSNEGVLYCKPHFKALFTPKAVEDEPQPTSDKPDLGLEELQNLNVKERFQVFEHHDNRENSLERTSSTVNVKRSPSILSKLAKFQQKGMDIGVADDSLNGVPVEESSSEAEEDDEELDGSEDPNLIRARRAAAQREIPLHFNNMSEVMSKWESGNQLTKEERREERKQEIQSIRSRLFMGKQGKMKEMYQQAVAESESGANVKKSITLDTDLCEGAKSLKDKFERGENLTHDEQQKLHELEEDKSVFETGISKKSRSIFLELDANASKPPQLTPLSPSKSGSEVRRAREAFMARQASEDVVRASDQLDDVVVKTADISNKFKFFETYKEQEKPRKQFRITPPRDGQVKMVSPDRDVYRDPDIIRSDDQTVDDSNLPKQTHTATKMLSIFRQMEENLQKKDEQTGPKPLKRFTPPPDGEIRREDSGSDEDGSESEEDADEDEVDDDDGQKLVDEDLIEAQKAARAKQLRAKFEKWEANEIQREQNNSSVNLVQEIVEGDSQIESARSLRARFESMRETNSDKERQPRVKVNRFV